MSSLPLTESGAFARACWSLAFSAQSYHRQLLVWKRPISAVLPFWRAQELFLSIWAIFSQPLTSEKSNLVALSWQQVVLIWREQAFSQAASFRRSVHLLSATSCRLLWPRISSSKSYWVIVYLSWLQPSAAPALSLAVVALLFPSMKSFASFLII